MKEILTDVSSADMVLTVNGKIIRAPTTPLARRNDAHTSKEAASKCESFRAKHEALIHEALFFFGDRGGSAKEIAAKIQMSDVQVNRRLSFMGGYEKGIKVRKGVIERTSEVRHGGHVWKVAK